VRKENGLKSSFGQIKLVISNWPWQLQSAQTLLPIFLTNSKTRLPLMSAIFPAPELNNLDEYYVELRKTRQMHRGFHEKVVWKSSETTESRSSLLRRHHSSKNHNCRVVNWDIHIWWKEIKWWWWLWFLFVTNSNDYICLAFCKHTQEVP
jgi:hypothetical protein